MQTKWKWKAYCQGNLLSGNFYCELGEPLSDHPSINFRFDEKKGEIEKRKTIQWKLTEKIETNTFLYSRD